MSGIRVAEFAGILAGPWAGQTLADLGADVIKAEPPRGDDTRKWGPPFAPQSAGGDAAYFHCCNRGKRSAIVDLKSAAGREAARRLVSRADVMIENFRPGGAKKYELDYESVSAQNPGIVVCAITGFGQSGPLSDAPGYDLIAQAMGGVMDITGAADGGPQKVGVAFADIFTGVYAVAAILAALRAREKTGRGQFIDMALLDSIVGVLANQSSNFLATGKSPQRMGNAHPNIAPYESFPASDGTIVIAAGNDAQFARMCAALDLEDLPERDAFKTNAARVVNRPALAGMISEKTRGLSRELLLGKLSAAEVPCGPVNSVGEALTSPQIASRGMVLEFPTTGDGKSGTDGADGADGTDGVDGVGWVGGSVRGLRTPMMFSGLGLNTRRPSPRLGEHHAEVMREIGL